MAKRGELLSIAALSMALTWHSLGTAAEAPPGQPASAQTTGAEPQPTALFRFVVEATVDTKPGQSSSASTTDGETALAVETPWQLWFNPAWDANTLALLGRADQNNRLNVFDGQSALPSNRVWLSLRRLEQYKTGLRPQPAPFFVDQSNIRDALNHAGLSTIIIDRQQETLIRLAAELRLDADTSLTVQGQYATMDGQVGSDFFTNPQLLLKQLLIQKPGFVLSGVLGYQPDVRTGFLEFNDTCHSLSPGMLFIYQDECHERVIVQGGFQFRIPLESNNVSTFDYVLSAGYWLWRHPSLDAVEADGVDWGRRPWVLAVVPQIEVYGKHVIGDATITDPFGLGPLNVGTLASPIPFNLFVYEEPRHVYDVTAGVKLLLGEASVLAGGVSVPFTGSRVRSPEYILTLSFSF